MIAHDSKFSLFRLGEEASHELAALAAAGMVVSEEKKDTISKEEQKQKYLKPITYKRKGTGWESIPCPCGRLNQISPSFSAQRVFCGDCGRKINIVN